MTMTTMTFYAGYLAVSLSIMVWVGMTLRRNGRKFLVRTLPDDDLADTINHLLQVGFYLANVGYIAAVIRIYEPLRGAQSMLEVGLPKLGGVMLILGLVHLFNMLILAKLRRGAERAAMAGHAVHTPADVLGGPYHLRS
jgi:hypothetical protein